MTPQPGDTVECLISYETQITAGKRYLVEAGISSDVYVHVRRDDNGLIGGYLPNTFIKISSGIPPEEPRFTVTGRKLSSPSFIIGGSGETAEEAIENVSKGRKDLEEIVWYVYELQYKETIKVEYKRTRVSVDNFGLPTIASKVEI